MASILVIDDDRAVLATVKILLERNGHIVDIFDNSRAGLQAFEIQKFDLLIVDIFMPGMDGFETMNRVHQSRPEVPIIVMSGHQFRSGSEQAPDFLRMATKLGAVSGLQKPFRPNDLLGAVARSLSDPPSSPRPLNAAQRDTPSN
jgi:CheY-like chemotaxis protein